MSTQYFSMPKQLMTDEYRDFPITAKMLFSIIFTHADTAQDIADTAALIQAINPKELAEMKKAFRQAERESEGA